MTTSATTTPLEHTLPKSSSSYVAGESVDFVRRLVDALEVKEGSRVELAVELSRSDSSNYVVWQKDGRTPGERATVIMDGTKHILVIDAANVHDEGEYIVSVGEQECSCELTVVGTCINVHRESMGSTCSAPFRIASRVRAEDGAHKGHSRPARRVRDRA